VKIVLLEFGENNGCQVGFLKVANYINKKFLGYYSMDNQIK